MKNYHVLFLINYKIGRFWTEMPVIELASKNIQMDINKIGKMFTPGTACGECFIKKNKSTVYFFCFCYCCCCCCSPIPCFLCICLFILYSWCLSIVAFFFVCVIHTANRKTTQKQKMSQGYVGMPNVIFAWGRHHPLVEGVGDVASGCNNQFAWIPPYITNPGLANENHKLSLGFDKWITSCILCAGWYVYVLSCRVKIVSRYKIILGQKKELETN